MDTASPSQLGAIRFGVFEVDLRAGELRKQGVKIKLQDQPLNFFRFFWNGPARWLIAKSCGKGSGLPTLSWISTAE